MGFLSKIRAAFDGSNPTATKSHPQRRPSDHPADYYGQGFEMATEGIEWPPEARDAVRATMAEVLNVGEWQANKALTAVWPDSFRWPEAELYLFDLDIDPTPRQMMILLRTHVMRATYQLLRIEQMREVAANSIAMGRPHVLVADTCEPEGVSRCGIRNKETRSCEVFLAEGMPPCLIFGCDCGWTVQWQKP
ncbi:hypothetical protein [Halomonas sp. H5]|uniref:hypothetical protein n=1 Tax=Halomonas sp. H5 TaxID=3423910 RepID=UPI003D36EC44